MEVGEDETVGCLILFIFVWKGSIGPEKEIWTDTKIIGPETKYGPIKNLPVQK